MGRGHTSCPKQEITPYWRISMFRFLLGVAFGAAGYWAWQSFGRDLLDRLGESLRARIAAEAAPERQVAALNALLFGEEGFRGNTASYYDPRNSYLNEVLDRRLGIPITLSLVYVEVGRRAGLPLSGVGFPGHFIVGG